MKRHRLILVAILFLGTLSAQSQSLPQQTLAFDVASIHQNKSDSPNNLPSTNVPLGPGDLYAPTGGIFTIYDQSLINLIAFAYKLTGDQLHTLTETAPAWVSEQRFDVAARTDKPGVAKDELRLMVRSLLAERFAFAAHYDSRVTAVFALELVKPGTPGPRLRPHAADGCSRDFKKDIREGEPPPPEAIDGGFPTTCGGLVMLSSTSALFRIGARDIPIKIIADAMPSWGDLGRPVVDQTGLTGHYDFALEYIPKLANISPDAGQPNFIEAIRKQLGLKLEPQKQPVPVFILDHIDHPTDN